MQSFSMNLYYFTSNFDFFNSYKSENSKNTISNYLYAIPNQVNNIFHHIFRIFTSLHSSNLLNLTFFNLSFYFMHMILCRKITSDSLNNWPPYLSSHLARFDTRLSVLALTSLFVIGYTQSIIVSQCVYIVIMSTL